MELEGIVSKRNETLYRSGRNKTSEIEPVIAEQARDQNGGLIAGAQPSGRGIRPMSFIGTQRRFNDVRAHVGSWGGNVANDINSTLLTPS
jgi:hypothetical protein